MIQFSRHFFVSIQFTIQFTIQFSFPTLSSRLNHIAVEFGLTPQMKCKTRCQSKKFKDWSVALCQVEYIIRTTVQGSICFHLVFTILRFRFNSTQARFNSNSIHLSFSCFKFKFNTKLTKMLNWIGINLESELIHTSLLHTSTNCPHILQPNWTIRREKQIYI